MGWGTIARLAAPVLIGAALGWLIWLGIDRIHQKRLADAARRCETAAITSAEPLDDCGTNVRGRVAAARRAAACEAALLPQLRAETRFAALQSCGAGTQRLIAVADAQAGEIAGLRAQLEQARADSGAAIARAEARGREEQTRRNNAQQVLAARPRGADGSVACDAECLRQLSR